MNSETEVVKKPETKKNTLLSLDDFLAIEFVSDRLKFVLRLTNRNDEFSLEDWKKLIKSL